MTTTMDEQMVAYDYDNQKWITGIEAAKLILIQCQEELDLVRSSFGKDYLKSIVKNDAPSLTFDEYVGVIQRDLDVVEQYLKDKGL